ncbi:hypothetical protein HDU80_004647 [Chytriomyces hyalinus]|nr:hypothetical protein HDU80_004647 [Chytriomyces hyalinus]
MEFIAKALTPFGGGGPLFQVPQGAIQAVVQRGAAQVSVNLNAIPVMATVAMMLCFTTVLLHPGLVASIDVQLALCVVLGVTAAAYAYVSRSRPSYTLQCRPDTNIFVFNGTGSPIQVAISTNSGPGSAESFPLQPGCSDTWKRGNGHEVVVVQSGNQAMGMCVRTGVSIAVKNVENIVPPQFRVEADDHDGKITIENQSGRDARFFVTKRSNPDGDDAWYPLGNGEKDSWGRTSYEVIVAEQDSVRVGVYATAGSRVVFLGNYKKIVIDGKLMCDISDDALAITAAAIVQRNEAKRNEAKRNEAKRNEAKNPSIKTTLRGNIIANVKHICEGNPKAANENGTVSIRVGQTQIKRPEDNSTYLLPFIEVARIKYFLLLDVIYYEEPNKAGKTVDERSCRICHKLIEQNRKLKEVLSHVEGCLGLSGSAIGLYTYQSAVELSAAASRTAPQAPTTTGSAPTVSPFYFSFNLYSNALTMISRVEGKQRHTIHATVRSTSQPYCAASECELHADARDRTAGMTSSIFALILFIKAAKQSNAQPISLPNEWVSMNENLQFLEFGTNNQMTIQPQPHCVLPTNQNDALADLFGPFPAQQAPPSYHGQSNSSIHINNMHSAPMGHLNYMYGLHVQVDDVGAVIPGFSALDISSKKEEKSDKVASDHKTYIKSEADAETSLSSCSSHKEEPIEGIRDSADDFVEAKPQPAQSGPNNPPYTIQHRIDTDIFVHNGTGSPIQVAVSKNSGAGSAESFPLQPGCSDTWKRDGRFVSVEIKAGDKSMGFDVPTGVNIAVKKVENTVPPQFRIEAGGTPGKITIENQSGRNAKFFVTKRSNPDGDDAWYEYGDGKMDSWGRTSSEVIVAEQDSVRVSVYAIAGSRVVFLGNKYV